MSSPAALLGDGLLAGVRVLDLGIWRPVPYATQLLVEMGADVIKVEPPGGDPMRVFPELFAALNAGKRAAAIDLKNERERAAVLDLAAGADVVIEGYRPGVADRLGLGDDVVRARNPSVVYCSISGYGQTGPRRDLAGHDVNYQAVAGVIEPRTPDGEPVVGRLPIADLASGAFAAMAVCAALVRAGRTGEGEYIDVAMTDVLATWTGPLPVLHTSDGSAMGGGAAGYGTFRCADGWVALGVVAEQHLWDALAAAVGMPEEIGLDFARRSAQHDVLNERIAGKVARQKRAEVVQRLTAAGVPVSPVLGQHELVDDVGLRARGVVHRDEAGAVFMGHPLTYREHPAARGSEVPGLKSGAEHLPGW